MVELLVVLDDDAPPVAPPELLVVELDEGPPEAPPVLVELDEAVAPPAPPVALAVEVEPPQAANAISAPAAKAACRWVPYMAAPS